MIELYLLGCVFVGFVMIVDGRILLRQHGKLNDSNDLHLTTTIEFIWFVVSLFALSLLSFPYPHILIPISYMAYNVLGWILGGIIVSNIKDDVEDLLDVFTIPLWAIWCGIVAGAGLSVCSATAYLFL